MSDQGDDYSFEFEDSDENSLVDSALSSDDRDSENEFTGGASSTNVRTLPSSSNSSEGVVIKNSIVYKPWTLKDFIQKFFLDEAISLKEMQLPQCDIDELLIMLHYKNWQKEDVINDYYDDLERFRTRCGLPEIQSNKKDSGLLLGTRFSCLICVEDYDNIDTYSLSCHHRYCINCYQKYVDVSNRNGQLIRCIQSNCNLSIPHKDVSTLQSASNGHILESEAKKPVPDSSNKLLAQAAKNYIETHKNIWKWCPAPDCNFLTQLIDRKYEDKDKENPIKYEKDLDISDVPIVTCPNNHQFCHDCQYENHLPCPCWIVKLWIKKCEDDSETANWIQANTQSCPKCGTLIEKNGGCNHMSCFKCGFEFCWICLSSWKEHGSSYYKCNRFNPEEVEAVKKVQQLRRLTLQRYLHFYKRFAVHESSMEGDKKMIEKVDHKMNLFMEEELKKKHPDRNLSWANIQFLHDAIRSLTNGRKTLKWTYCFAFYLAKSNFAEIFEQMQDYLNKVVEDLSLIFEELNNKKNKNNSDIIIKRKKEIINLSDLIVKRQNLLIECAQSGLNQGLLYFETS